MNTGAVRAICFDLDNTLWHIEPVLLRAERILTDWLVSRYPRLREPISAQRIPVEREALLRAAPHRAHDLTYLRRETLCRVAIAAGYAHDEAAAIAAEAFAIWHAERNRCEPCADVLPAFAHLRPRFRLATLTNGNADLGRIGLAHHFDVSLHAGALGCAKPEARAYLALAAALTLQPAEILFVGDDPQADVHGPRQVGMQTVWINRVGARWPEGIPPADASVTHLGELVNLLTS